MPATLSSREETSPVLEKIACPRCGWVDSAIVTSGKDHLYSIAGEFYVSECLGCKLWFQNPRPPDELLVSLYPKAYGPHMKPEETVAPAVTAQRTGRLNPLPYALGVVRRFRTAIDQMTNRNAGVELVPQAVPEGRLLEIGCANGSRLLELRSQGWKNLFGIELVPAAAERARAEGFSVECGQVEHALEAYPDDSFDVIVSSMVLEHLSNPFATVRRIAAKLRPGGQFLFSTICRDSLDLKVYGEYWAGFDFPRHLVHLSKRDIQSMLESEFEGIECFHQTAPIDYVRSSTWRRADNKKHFFDRVVLKWGMSRTATMLSTLLASLGLTCRVSYRCRRSY